MSQTKKVLKYGERTITLIGTAHISNESVQEVTSTIKEDKPDCIGIELDSKRYESMMNPDSWQNLDIVKVLKAKQGFLMLANLVLGSFQRRMGENVGVKPGDEMKASIEVAKEMNIPFEMVDRPIHVTLRRAWAKNSLWGKCKLLATMISSAFDKEEISQEEIEALKNENEMDSMMGELSSYLPKVKEVLIDERDRYLACHIWECKGNNVMAVLGAGHLPGVQRHLEQIAAGNEKTDTSDISTVPEKGVGSKVAGWIIPILLILLVVMGFYFGGKNMGQKMIGSWIIWNSLLAGIGTIIAGGHPLTILVAIVGAPITSLCPVIGVGMCTGLVQAIVCKPKVKDMETVQVDAENLKGFYKNRILRVLLVFILSTIGSAAGTFIAGASFVKDVSGVFGKFVDKIVSFFKR
jgi:pheromone shutdown-related protein TraB